MFFCISSTATSKFTMCSMCARFLGWRGRLELSEIGLRIFRVCGLGLRIFRVCVLGRRIFRVCGLGLRNLRVFGLDY